MILNDLKEHTSLQHKQLESHPLLHQLTSDDLTLTKYSTILRKFYGFFSPLEERIATHISKEQLADLEKRRKSSLLLLDLERLEQTLPTQICEDLPEIKNTAQALGTLYVMEGSTLGGQMIARQLHKSLGLSPERGTAFFYGYGKDTGKQWKRFQAALTQFSEEEPQYQRAIYGAQNTFSKFYNWLHV
ncbi:biliverdin-producing heme oxygenase [Porifericola rhodea]|uniref:biliverdin-producing heme oxygenase n=1 Tax=Porifericola rhodea TaxID=930972 RepID=UPI002666D46B|nr:biliverdin-producing heme oxygenase [Porifericola rhodea]WKN32328.1 biliverdin-producing heme oxygenase [Porifericola rhodea]